MTKRKRGYGNRYRPGGLLDDLPAAGMGIVDFAMLPAHKRQALIDGDTEKRCCCPPKQKHRLGGCHPALTWADDDHTALKPICINCMKSLVSGEHRRRDQTHVIALSKMQLDHINLADLEAAGMFVDCSTPFNRGELDRLDRAMEQFQLERVGGLPEAAGGH